MAIVALIVRANSFSDFDLYIIYTHSHHYLLANPKLIMRLENASHTFENDNISMDITEIYRGNLGRSMTWRYANPTMI